MMLKNFSRTTMLIALAILLLTACASPVNPTVAPTPQTASTPQAIQTQTTSHEAQVQSVEIQIINANSAQVNAIVHGNLTESCATLG